MIRIIALAGILIFVFALIVLPTGTPEDAFTTVILVAVLGINGYILLAILALILLALAWHWGILPI